MHVQLQILLIFLIGHRGDTIEETIYIDMRGGSVRKPPIVENKIICNDK